MSDSEFSSADEYMSEEEIASDNDFLSEDQSEEEDELSVEGIYIPSDGEDSDLDETEEEDSDLDETEDEDESIESESEPVVRAKKQTKIIKQKTRDEDEIIQKPKSIVKGKKISESIIDTSESVEAKPRFEGRKKLDKTEKIISAPSSNIKYESKIGVIKEDGQTMISDKTSRKKIEKLTKMERYEIGIDNMPYAFREMYKVLEKTMTYPLIRTSGFIYDCSYPDF